MVIEPKVAAIIGQQTVEIELLRAEVKRLIAENQALKDRLNSKEADY